MVFLHNSVVASDSGQPHAPGITPQIDVPPLNQSDSSILGAPRTLLQTASDVAADWLPDSITPDQANALRTSVADVFDPSNPAGLPVPAITVAPQQSAALSLPLGWALSPGTEKSMDDSLDAYLTCTPSGTRTCSQSRAFDNLLSRRGTSMKFPLSQ
jgi:hypothetical protein